jgi:hypothetical protein
MKTELDNQIISNAIENLKIIAARNVDHEISNLNIIGLEAAAKKHLKDLSNGRIYPFINQNLTGVYDLLYTGEFIFLILSDLANEETITTASLQNFTNAMEIMISVTFILIASDQEVKDYIELSIQKRSSIYHLIESLGNTALNNILIDYLKIRNTGAHAYTPISIPKARSIINSTFEHIRRLELIINP